MAFILCGVHGGTPCSHVCPHIFDDVINGRRVDAAIQLDAEYLDEPAWRVQLCARCSQLHGHTESTVVDGDDALDTLMAIEQSPVCHKCFDGLRGQLAAD